MTTEIGSDVERSEALFEYLNWALETGVWNGIPIQWHQGKTFQLEAAQKIIDLLFSKDPDSVDFLGMATGLAKLGALEENSYLLAKEIDVLQIAQSGMVLQVGFKKSCSKFWKKHKKEIIIGLAIAAAITAVVVVAICLGPGAASATGSAAAGGLKAGIDELNNDDETYSDRKQIASKKNDTASNAEDTPNFLSDEQEGVITFLEDRIEVQGQSFAYQDILKGQNVQPLLDALRSEAYKIHSSFDPTSYKPWEMSQETANYLMHFGSSPSADSREFESNAHSPNTPANPSIQETTLPLSQHPGVEIFRKVYQEALRNNNVSGATSMTEKDILDRVLFEMTNLPPFEPQATPLIGRADQPKIHYHCGINNSMQTVNEGGACLYKTLGKEIAVQPHWIHQEGMGHGASMVAAELIADQVGKLSPSTNPYSYPDVEHDLNWLARSICYGADQVVTRSDIQKSIDYEVELLAKTSREILEQNNPKLKQVHVAFSNGGYVIKEAIKQLPEEYKDTIIVITIGSTRIIEDSLGCHETYNVIGEKDWASRACNGGERAINAAGEHATIHMIPQAETESIVQGHYFMQPDYQDKIYDILQKDIIGVYEMY